MRNRVMRGVILASIAACLLQGTETLAKDTGKKEKNAADGAALAVKAPDEDGVRAALHDFESAIDAKDAEKCAEFWADQAVLIDENGEVVSGRPAIRERFARLAAANAAANVGLHPSKITFPVSTVALVTGDVSRKSGERMLPATRFTMEFVNSNGRWLIIQATETKIAQPEPVRHLAELDWLIGKWKVSGTKSSTTLEATYDEGKNFIRTKCTKTAEDQPSQVDYQVIGWDPKREKIVSWHFDCHGGYGYGQWRNEGNDWIVNFAGVSADGASNSAVNVFQKKSTDEFVWRPMNQQSEGTDLPNGDGITVVREK